MKSDKLTTWCHVKGSHWQDLLDCEDGNIYYFDDGMFKLRKTKDPGVKHCLKKKKGVLEELPSDVVSSVEKLSWTRVISVEC